MPYAPDQTRLWQRWRPTLRGGDPFSNPNLDDDRVDCDLDRSRLDDYSRGRPTTSSR